MAKEKKSQKAEKAEAGGWAAQLRVPSGPVDLTKYDTRATTGFDGSKEDGKLALEGLGAEVSDWQEKLFAEGRQDGRRSILLVLQGMDTSGKGGVIRHGAGLMDPQGLKITSFKAPTPAEKRRGFLWRIKQALPDPGLIGIFDRSHYEDVLIARVRNLVTPNVWNRRYEQINDFEAELDANGVTLLKCYLHISEEEQKARLDDPTKHWKYNPGDVDERKLWPSYMAAYQTVFERTSTDHAPWHVVPADRKWYARLAVQHLLLEALEEIDPHWPLATFDVEAEKKRLAAS